MSILDVVAVSCFGAGVLLVTLCAAATLWLRRPEDRLHLLAPMTSVGAPLVGLGLVLENGWSLTSAQIALTCAVLALTGPAVTSAAARVAGMREGSVPQESPE